MYMNASSLIGLLQVIIPFLGAWLVGHGVITANVWTEIGTVIIAIAGAGWSAQTTVVTPPPPPKT